MTKIKIAFVGVLAGFFGMLVGLGLWQGYRDYQDFRAIRVWVAQMQQIQAQQAAQAQPPAK